MTTEAKQIRRVPVADIKTQQKQLLETTGLIASDYTGKVVLTLDYHRGSLNGMQIDRPIKL